MKRYKLGRAAKKNIALLLSLVIALGVFMPLLDTTASAAYVEVEEFQVHQTSDATIGSNYRNLSLNPGALNSEMRFTWHSGSPTGSIVITNPSGNDWVLVDPEPRLAEAHAGIGTMGDTSYLLPTRPGYVYFVHQVSVYDLAPQTTYTYVVTWEGGESAPKTFSTGGGDSFSFIIAGDPQIGTGDGLAPTGAIAEAGIDGGEWMSALTIANARADNAEFILSVGDQVHSANGGAADFRHVRVSQYRHDRMFSPTELHNIPLMAVVGNHDGWSFDDNNANPRLWPMHYNIPAPDTVGTFDQNNGGIPTVFRHATRFYTQFDYWVVWGNTLFLVLDSNVRTMSGARLDFLNTAVNENRDRHDVDWVVAVYHHPAYCVYRARNIAEKNEVVANWIPHFERLGVDIVLNGHAHVYNRTFHMLENEPVKDQLWLDADGEIQDDDTGLLYNAVLNPEGIVYFVFNSASGSGYYNVSNMPRSYIATYNQNFRRNFSVADVTPDMFSIRTYQINNDGSQSLVDVYTIVRSDDGLVPEAVLPLPQMTEQIFERFTQPDDLTNVLHPGDVAITAEMFGLPETIGVETNLFSNVGGNIGNIRPPNAQAAPTSYGTVVRTPRADVVWYVADSDFDPEDLDAQSFIVVGYVYELPAGIYVPEEYEPLLPFRIYIEVSVLPYGVRPVGDIARWMQYPPGHTNHPLGMEAYFLSHGQTGVNVRRPQAYRTYGEAEPLRFFADDQQRMFNWEAGAPNITQNLAPSGGVGDTGSGLHGVTGEAYWVTRVSTEGQAGIEVQFNMRSDAAGPRDWQVQFSTDGDNWIDAGDVVMMSGFWDNQIIRTLPAAANDQPVLYVRWLMASNLNVNNAPIVATARHHMRDVIIRSTFMPGGEIPGDDDHMRIDLLMFNDFHGHISHARPDDNNPGAARLAAYIQHLRYQNENPENVVVMGGGDDFHGYAVSTLLRGAPVVTMMEEMLYHSPSQEYFPVAFGNHELSFGLERGIELGTNYDITLLAADLVYASGPNAGEHPAFVRPYSIMTFDNDGEEVQVALVGLMTSTMDSVVGGWPAMGFEARTPAPNAPAEYTQDIADLIADLRDRGVTAVVGLTHKYANAPSMLYIARELDFDAIFGAHRHIRLVHEVNNTPIIEAASHGRAIGRFTLVIDEQGDLVRVEPWISPVNAIRDFNRDRAVIEGVEEYYDSMADLMAYYQNNPEIVSYLNDPRGPIGIYFDTRANRDMWASRLVLDYVERWAKEHFPEDESQHHWVGVSNSGGWRNTGQWPRNAGDTVNYADLLSTMPFDNNLLLFEMHGIDLIRLLGNTGVVGGGVVRAGVHHENGNWYVTSSGERITFDRNNTYNVIASNFIFGGIDVPGGDAFPLPGNYQGNNANMQIISDPRVVMRPMEGQTPAEFEPYITWQELTAISYSSADWEELGVVMIRNALVDSTEFRGETPNDQWQAELTVIADGGSAQITSPFAPGNRSRNLNAVPQRVTVTASGTDFIGWFNVGDPEDAQPLSEDSVFSFTIREDTHLEARFGIPELDEIEIATWNVPPMDWTGGLYRQADSGEQADTAEMLLLRDGVPQNINRTANGMNIQNSLPRAGLQDAVWWQTQISTEGLQDIEVQWQLRSTATGPRDWNFEFSTNGSDWTTAKQFVAVNETIASGNLPVREATLPTAAENQEVLYLRWVIIADDEGIYRQVNGAVATSAFNNQLANVVITGVEAEEEMSSIAYARSQAGTGVQVTVEGYITGTVGNAAAGAMQAPNASGPNDGIIVSLAGAAGYMGQRIQVTGYVQMISGNLRMTSVNSTALGNNVQATVLEQTRIQIAPLSITLEQAETGFDGMLVAIMEAEFGTRAGTGTQNHTLTGTTVALRTNMGSPAALLDVDPGDLIDINRGHVVNNLGGGTWRQIYSTTFNSSESYDMTGFDSDNRITMSATDDEITFSPTSTTISDTNLSQVVTVGGTATGNISISYVDTDVPEGVTVAYDAVAGTVTVTGVRPTTDVPPVTGNFDISVTRDGVTESFTVTVNLTTTYSAVQPISIADAREEAGTGVQVTIEGYITGTVGAAAAGAMQAPNASGPNDGIVVSLAGANSFMGQRIQVTGYVNNINGNLRITSQNNTTPGNNVTATVINATPIQIAPLPITLEQVATGFDAMLVTVRGVEFDTRVAGTGAQNHALANTTVALRTNMGSPAALLDVDPGDLIDINRGHVMNNLGNPGRQIYSTTFDAVLHYNLTGIHVDYRVTAAAAPTVTLNPTSVTINDTNLSQVVTVGGTATGNISISYNDEAVPTGVTVAYNATAGTVTVTGVRPTTDVQPITGSFDIGVIRQGVTEIFTVTINLTTTWTAPPPIVPIADAREEVGSGTRVTIEGYITGTVGAAAAGAMQAVNASGPNDGIVVSLANAATFMGQRIQATGYVQLINGNLRMTGVNSTATGNNVTATVINATPTQIAPLPITLEQAATGFDAMLVTVRGVEFDTRAAGTGAQNHALANTTVALRTNMGSPVALLDVDSGDLLDINRGHVMNNLGNPGRQIYSTTFDAALHYNLTGIHVDYRVTVAVAPTVTFNPASVAISDTSLTQAVTVGGTATGNISISYVAANVPEGVSVAYNATAGTVTVTGVRPTTEVPPVTGSFDVSVTRQGVTETFTVTVNLTTTYTPAPIVTFNPASVTISDTNLSQVVTVGGTATGNISISYNDADVPAGVTVAYNVASGTVNLTGVRPTTDVPPVTGSFNISVTREGITEEFTVTVNLTTTHIPAPTVTFNPTGVTINDTNLSQAVTVEGTATGNISISYVNADVPAGVTVAHDAVAGTVTVTGVRPTTDVPPVTGSFVISVTRQNVTEAFTVAVNLTTTYTPAPVDAQPPAIDPTTPADWTGDVGETVTLTVAATGTGAITYQWQSYENGAWVNIDGATSASFSPDTTIEGTNYYRVIVTNTDNTVSGNPIATTTSREAIVTVSTTPLPPTVTFNPPSTTINDGNLSQVVGVTGTATGSISVSHTIPAALQNYITVTYNAGAGTITVTGVRPSTEVPPLNGHFNVYVTREGTTESFRVNVEDLTTTWTAPPPPPPPPPPTITVINLANWTGNIGGNVTLEISATAEIGQISFQWQHLVNGVWVDLLGATGASFVPDTSVAGENSYRVVVTNTVGDQQYSVESSAAVVTVTAVSQPPPPPPQHEYRTIRIYYYVEGEGLVDNNATNDAPGREYSQRVGTRFSLTTPFDRTTLTGDNIYVFDRWTVYVDGVYSPTYLPDMNRGMLRTSFMVTPAASAVATALNEIASTSGATGLISLTAVWSIYEAEETDGPATTPPPSGGGGQRLPQTGVESNMIIWIVLFAVAVLAAVGVVVLIARSKRKGSKEEESQAD